MKASDAKSTGVSEKAVRRLLASGENLQLIEFFSKKGGRIPRHKHPNEQLGYIVKGRNRMIIGEKECILDSGDSYYIPPNVEHEAETLEDAVVLDIFSPPRDDYR